MRRVDDTDTVVAWAHNLIQAALQCVRSCPEPLKEVAFQIFLGWMIENWPPEEE